LAAGITFSKQFVLKKSENRSWLRVILKKIHPKGADLPAERQGMV